MNNLVLELTLYNNTKAIVTPYIEKSELEIIDSKFEAPTVNEFADEILCYMNDMLEVYDMQLVQCGLEIQKKRKVAIFKFNEIFTKLYNDITGIENVRMVYEPSWKEVEDGVSKRIPNENEVLEIVKSKRDIGLCVSGI